MATNNKPPETVTYDLNKYSVGDFQYPIGLGTTPDLQHTVAFYINVRGKSIYDKNNRFSGVVPTNGTSGITQAEAGSALQNLGAGMGVVGLVGAGKGLLSGIAASKGGALNTGVAVGKSLASSKQLAYLATASVGGALIGTQHNEFLKSDNKQRLKDVITLHLQERPSVKYGINYQNVDLGAIAGFLGKMGSATDSSEATAYAMAEIARMPSVIPGVGATPTNLIGVSAKVKTNPFREVLFESVDYRTFNFKYKFFPRSAAESRNVKNIIDKFKFHMHPELSENGFFYIYPSEFEIRYMFKDAENKNFNKISNCALVDMQVDYGGDRFSSFSDGAPTEIDLALTFRELEIMTKKEIKNGF